jgi:hypothetical protein
MTWMPMPTVPANLRESVSDPAARATRLHGRVWHDEAPLLPGSVRVIRSLDHLGARGEVTQTLTMEYRRVFSNGRYREELLSAREDDKDVTERARRTQAASVDDRRDSESRWSVDDTLTPSLPFLGAPQKYRLAASTHERIVLEYTPVGASGTRTASGSVVLDPSDGLPVSHLFRPAPLPSRIHSLVTTVRYGRAAGLAVPESSVSVGERRLLFLRRRFRILMSYREWALTTVDARPRSP